MTSLNADAAGGLTGPVTEPREDAVDAPGEDAALPEGPLEAKAIAPADELEEEAPLTRARAIAWAAIVTVASLLTGLVTTWPLAANIWTAIPTGMEPKGTVSLYSLWTLWWNADRLAHFFANYWDAPIFYPNTGVFTYSETEPLIALPVAPLWGLGASPALIHNVALLMVLTLNGIFAYRLARAVNATRLASLMGAMLAVALPFVAREYGITNLTPIFGMLWALEGIVRFGRGGTWGQAAWAAAGIVVTYLTCQQYLLIFLPFALVAGLVALAQQDWSLRSWIRLGTAGIAALGIVVALVLPVLQVHNELDFESQRPTFVVQALSAEPIDFVTRPATASVPFPPGYLDDTGGLFPGFILLALALFAVYAAWREKTRRRWLYFMVGSVLGSIALALGLNLNLDGLSIYGLLRGGVPGFNQLRTPFRFAIVMQTLLPVMAAVGLTFLGRKLGRRAAFIIVPLALLGAAENLTIPNPMFDLPTRVATPWTEWLRSQPQGTVIAHVPFPANSRVWDYEIEGWRMLAQTAHGKPIVNGFSSYFPPDYVQFQIGMAQQFPEQGLMCQLSKGLLVNTLVIDNDWLAANGTKLAAFSQYLTRVYNDGQVSIYHLSMADDQCKPPPQGQPQPQP